PAALFHHAHDSPLRLHLLPALSHRKPVRRPRGPRRAAGLERARVTPGTLRKTERGAQLHQGLVEVARPLARDGIVYGLLDPAAGARLVHRLLDPQVPGHHPQHVAVHGALGLAEGDACHRRRGLVADPLHRPPGGVPGGKLPPVAGGAPSRSTAWPPPGRRPRCAPAPRLRGPRPTPRPRMLRPSGGAPRGGGPRPAPPPRAAGCRATRSAARSGASAPGRGSATRPAPST